MADNRNHDAPVRSMTGFARVRRPTTLGELIVSLRSVNHRSLDFHFHQSSEFFPFENTIRAVLKQHLSRGHVEVRIGLQRTVEKSASDYNREIVGAYVNSIRKAAAEFGVDTVPDLNAAFRLPGAFSSDRLEEIETSFEPDVVAAVAACLEELNRFREREGMQLAALLRGECSSIQVQARQMRDIRAEAAPQFQRRLDERLAALLSGIQLDARRLAEEAALLADRSDIQEEISRLEIHTDQLLTMIDVGGELGKKIDFLLQEMNRETNTILSKTSGIGDAGLKMTDLALATKANIERMREQALNIE